jgi:hypothetical protein
MATWALLLFLPRASRAIDGPSTAAWTADGMPAAATVTRSLVFACADNEVDVSITVFDGYNACASGALFNYVTITTASGEYSDYATATSTLGATATFDAFFNIGCVAENESYIQFVLSYRQFWYSYATPVTCITVQDLNWTTASSSYTVSSGSSSVTFSKNVQFPPTPAPTQAPSLIPPSTQPSKRPFSAPTLAPSSAPTAVCSSGYYYNRASVLCSACPLGHYSNYSAGYANFSACLLCPAGRFAISTGSETCAACAAGKLSQPTRITCSDCNAGEYAKDDIECVNCPIGHYAPQPLAESCLTCAAGHKTNKKIAATSCSACDAGTTCALAGTCALNCSACPNGTYSISGRSICTACMPGW